MARGTTESSFDELTRGLASGSISRGRPLRLMGAALVGGTLASLGIGEAAAAPRGCKREGKNCKRDTQCCSGNCEGGKCAACPSGSTPCGTGTTLACCAQGEQCGVDGVCGPACVSDGGSCGIDSDCCSGLLCDNGTCATCRSSGGSCADGEMCCDNGFCEANGTCCSRIGGRCFTYEDCCGSIPGTCSSGFCTI